MTYLEKIMSEVEVECELLTEEKRLKLTEAIKHMICDRYCPHNFLDVEDLSPNCNTCCEDCWNQEAK